MKEPNKTTSNTIGQKANVILKVIVSLIVLWVVLNVLVLMIMSIPATNILSEIEDGRDSDLTIKITGHQWRWHYEYVDHDIRFFSVEDNVHSTIKVFSLENDKVSTLGQNNLPKAQNVLLVPSGRKVRAQITSNDVIHAWWVPSFGVKKDAIPGYINELWFNVYEGEEGIYQGGCAELCGDAHAYMNLVVKVVTASEFDEWLAAGADLTALVWTPPPTDHEIYPNQAIKD